MSMQVKRHANGETTVTLSLPEKQTDVKPFPAHFSALEWDTTYSTPPRAEVKYTKRGGGVFVYSNNPEMLAPEDVGQALLRNTLSEGKVFFTYEHSNHTGAPFFLGYQLYNDGDAPVTVTVSNIGNQVRGEWLGQREWCDFYGIRYDLPADYWNPDGKTVNPIYVGGDYIEYSPQPYAGETYVIPAGGYAWVLGGTSGDKVYGTLSGKTADQAILPGKCANGVVYFDIQGGSLVGTVWCYTDPSQCDPHKPEQGYIVNRNGRNYAAQYKGIDDHACGLAEAEINFLFDDSSKGCLPVTYKVRRDPNYASVTEPYAPFTMQEFTVEGDRWLTSLNPNNNPTAVGTDMMVFRCVTEDGKEVVIDNEHNDGEGKKSNTGNWMMQNQTNFTFVNAGKTDRKLRLFTRNTGVLAVMIRDENGKLLDSKMILQPYNFGSPDEAFAGVDKSLLVEKNGRWWFRVADGRPYCDVWEERSFAYELVVPAEQAVRLTMEDVILANSCGGVNRWVEIV